MLPLVVFAAIAADIPSFPCGPMNSPTEAAIYSDPELSAYDRAMAIAYRQMPPNMRATQKAWLATRNKCGESKKLKVCLRRAYTDRLLQQGGIFGTSEKPEAASVPVFRRTNDGGPGGLALLDVGGGKFVYHLWATFFSYAYNPSNPEEISGDTFGVIEMKAGHGHEIATNECDFTISPYAGGWKIAGADPCLGMNNNPNGVYLPKWKGALKKR